MKCKYLHDNLLLLCMSFILEQYFIPGSAVQVINKTSIVEAHVGLPATVQWLLRGINTSYSLTINKDGDNVILDYIFGHPTVIQQTIYEPIGDSTANWY